MNAAALAALEPFFSLSHNVSIIVPSTNDVDKAAIDRDLILDEVIAEMSTMFGGATATDGTGGWMSPTAGLVTEKVTVVESSCSEEQLNGLVKHVIGLAMSLRDRMTQDAVAVKIDGKLFLV